MKMGIGKKGKTLPNCNCYFYFSFVCVNNKTMPDNKRIIYKMFTYYLLCSPSIQIPHKKVEEKKKIEMGTKQQYKWKLHPPVFIFFLILKKIQK